MPYCPRCDMEFVEGITVCSDCKGPLVESEEAARELKRQEEQQKQLELEAQLEKQAAEFEADFISEEPSEEKLPPMSAQVFVKKEQKYEDLKSSVSAFLVVGILLTAAAVVGWSGIVSLPFAGFQRILVLSALTCMGVFALIVAVRSAQEAKKLAPQIAAENRRTKELVQWFLDTYTPEDIDREIPDSEFLPPEELSLKRFQLMQDLLITHHDLPDPAYVDVLCEEIYGTLFE